jgi:allantoicase
MKEEITVSTFIPKKKDPPSFTKFTDLLSKRVGGKVLGCSDDFFASAENLVKPEPPIFIPDKYTDHGKWMDGLFPKIH